MSWDIVAYVFGCSVYCRKCAAKFEDEVDSEGNSPLPVHTWDSWECETPEHCTDCFEPLDLSLSKSGAAGLLEEIRRTVMHDDKDNLEYAKEMLHRFKWDLRGAGLSSEESEDLAERLEAMEGGAL